jgi:hypothetical protein
MYTPKTIIEAPRTHSIENFSAKRAHPKSA